MPRQFPLNPEALRMQVRPLSRYAEGYRKFLPLTIKQSAAGGPCELSVAAKRSYWVTQDRLFKIVPLQRRYGFNEKYGWRVMVCSMDDYYRSGREDNYERYEYLTQFYLGPFEKYEEMLCKYVLGKEYIYPTLKAAVAGLERAIDLGILEDYRERLAWRKKRHDEFKRTGSA